MMAFWAVSFLFVITLGADWAYAISAGLQGRSVVPAVLGMLSGHVLATMIVAAGVGGLLVKIPYALFDPYADGGRLPLLARPQHAAQALDTHSRGRRR